ncbi:PaaI family thioesterase [Chloroflexota bacterium]
MVVLPRISIDTNLNEGLCFGCGHNNPIRLKLSFTRDGDTCQAEFTPGQAHQGWPGFVHGGILTCLLDEAMSYAAYFKGITCLTTSMQIRLRQPVKVEVPLVITASVTRNRKKLIEASASVCLKDGTIIAESTSKQFVVDHKPVHSDVSEESCPDA